MPALNFTWYDGSMIPKEVAGERVPANGVMFIGTQGKMFADYEQIVCKTEAIDIVPPGESREVYQ